MAPEEVWAIFVGRLTREKGVDVLLRALEGDAGVDGLLVVGDGAERPRLEAGAARTAVPVRFCGYHEDVSGFLAAGDIFVQPSRSEGLPFAVLEAMAHGLPIVCSHVGGLSSAVDGCGRLVPRDDPLALGCTLRALARDVPLRRVLGAAGTRRVVEEFGVPPMMAALHRAYDEASGARVMAGATSS
jgi:glycosyltransferase involved in cell wall biosynthesis